MLCTYCEVNISLTTRRSIKSGFYQMLFQWSTNLIVIGMELKQTLWQLTIVQTISTQKASNHTLVFTFFDQSIYTLTFHYLASIIKGLEESKIMNTFKETAFYILSRHIIISIKEFK